MNDYGTITEAGAIRFERLLPGPIERVWAYLTESDKRGKWLASGAVEPRVGGQVELHFRHADLSPQKEPVPEKYRRKLENGASFTAEVTRCEPPRLLSHTWTDGSEVTFELAPQGEQVLLVLTHHRLTPTQMLSVAGGWHTHLGILVDQINGRVPRPFWSTHARLEREYERRIQAA
jgi:uncharacterized protein YndB with AHSA1/START domain